MKNCFISLYNGGRARPATILKEELDFEIVELNGMDAPSITNKSALLKKELRNILHIINNFNKINKRNIVICPGYVCLFLLLLKKLKILKIKYICWFGVFIHNPKMVKLLSVVIKSILPKNNGFKIIVFSRAEIELYSKEWRLDADRFIYIPYGDWSNIMQPEPEAKQGDYFFSGGYSNRDYVSLIKIFTGRREKLIIAASKQNRALTEYVQNNFISENISIFYDLESTEFNRLLSGSKAVVLVMNHNTGAAGQMVVLNAMINCKLIIASYTDVLNEYIKNGQTAIVFKREEIYEVLPEVISDVCENIDNYQYMTNAAFERYKKMFSYKAISENWLNAVRKLL